MLCVFYGYVNAKASFDVVTNGLHSSGSADKNKAVKATRDAYQKAKYSRGFVKGWEEKSCRMFEKNKLFCRPCTLYRRDEF